MQSLHIVKTNAIRGERLGKLYKDFILACFDLKSVPRVRDLAKMLWLPRNVPTTLVAVASPTNPMYFLARDEDLQKDPPIFAAMLSGSPEDLRALLLQKISPYGVEEKEFMVLDEYPLPHSKGLLRLQPPHSPG